MFGIGQNLGVIEKNITNIMSTYGLSECDRPRIIAVSKQQPIDKIRELLDLGHVDFGENKVQEALEKWQLLKEEYPHVKLHFIGHLQSNKVKEVVNLFDSIHSLDSLKLINLLQKEEQKVGKELEHFLQINIGAEVQKSGFDLHDFDNIYQDITTNLQFKISGLMAMPPAGQLAANYFALIYKIAHRNQISGLSIGMSQDYEQAVMFAPKYLRIGSILFGNRQN